MKTTETMFDARWDRLHSANKANLPALTAARARRLLADFPTFGQVWKILGSALIELARYEEAEEALLRAIALCPPERLWVPRSEMGRLRAIRGDFDGAEFWYRQAVETAPDHADPRVDLGGLLARSGRLTEAEAILRAAVWCREGCHDEAMLNLGLVLRALDRLDESAECFETALKLNPNHRGVKRALRDVRQTLRLARRKTRKSIAQFETENDGAREPEAAAA